MGSGINPMDTSNVCGEKGDNLLKGAVMQAFLKKNKSEKYDRTKCVASLEMSATQVASMSRIEFVVYFCCTAYGVCELN